MSAPAAELALLQSRIQSLERDLSMAQRRLEVKDEEIRQLKATQAKKDREASEREAVLEGRCHIAEQELAKQHTRSPTSGGGPPVVASMTPSMKESFRKLTTAQSQPATLSLGPSATHQPTHALAGSASSSATAGDHTRAPSVASAKDFSQSTSKFAETASALSNELGRTNPNVPKALGQTIVAPSTNFVISDADQNAAQSNASAATASIARPPLPFAAQVRSFSVPLPPDTFSRLMSPLCMHTLLELLHPHERIASRTVSRQFATAAVRSTLWSRSIYKYDSIELTPVVPRSPFRTSDKTLPDDVDVGPLPPLWLRSALGGVTMHMLSSMEMVSVLSKFSSIRSLTISIQTRIVNEFDDVSQLRSAFRALERLEELSFECDDHEVLLRAFFGSTVTTDNTLLAPPTTPAAPSDEYFKTLYSQMPAIWTYVSTLRRLEFLCSKPVPMTFLVFAETMSQRRWTQLEYLQYVDYAEPDSISGDETRIACEKLFSTECLPQLKHLIVRGWRYGSSSSDEVNNSRATGGFNLPHLLHLSHSLFIRNQYGGFGSVSTFNAFQTNVGSFTFGAPPISDSSMTEASTTPSSNSITQENAFSFGSAVPPLNPAQTTTIYNSGGFLFGHDQISPGTEPTTEIAEHNILSEFGATRDTAATLATTTTTSSESDSSLPPVNQSAPSTGGFGAFVTAAPTSETTSCFHVTADSALSEEKEGSFAGFVPDPAQPPSEKAIKPAGNDANIEYSSGLIYLQVEQFVHWSSLSRLSRLTYLVMDEIRNMPRTSLELFQSIGHHALPHLATLSIPCLAEPNWSVADAHRVFNLMSEMTSLTALHGRRVNYADSLAECGFQWFVHIYQFPSLERIAFGVVGSSCEYRTVPLPLPRRVMLTPNQHRLYPNGSIDLPPLPPGGGFDYQPLLEPPRWLTIDPPTAPSKFERVPFTSPPEIEYINADTFRDRMRDIAAEGKLVERILAARANAVTNITTPGEDHFTQAMSDLCMTFMLTYLPAFEVARTQSVNRHFHRSVLHSAVWKNMTFRVTDAGALPSPSVCSMIGGINFSNSSTMNQWSLFESTPMADFPALRRLTLMIPPKMNKQLVHTIHNPTADGSQSTLINSSSAASPRLESLVVKIDNIDTESNKRIFNSWTCSQMDKIWLHFFEVKKGSPPLIYNYANSLKQLELTIFFSSDDHETRACAMSRRVWSALETFEIRWVPFGGTKEDEQDQGSFFPKNALLPFEHILTHSNELLPQLWSVGLEFSGFNGLPVENDLPLASLTRIFTALSASTTLSRLSHPFSFLNDQVAFTDVYPSSLTALYVRHPMFVSQHLTRLSSLTELRLEKVSNLKPTHLFECIGHHSMPSLATFSIPCSTWTYPDDVECARESEQVKKLMAQMTALTQLHSEHVKYDGEITPTSFCWFAHAYLFLNLKRIEYMLDIGELPSHYILWQHTLLPPPPSNLDGASTTSITHHLLPSPSHFQPPHIYCPVEKYLRPHKFEYYNSITAQSEYTYTSFEELQLEYLNEMKKAKEESRIYQLPELRDTCVKFTSSVPASLVAASKDELSFTVLPKQTQSSTAPFSDQVPTGFGTSSSSGFGSLSSFVSFPFGSPPVQSTSFAFAGDRKFAHNCGLTFHTPEEYFLGHKKAAFSLGPDLSELFAAPSTPTAAAASSPSASSTAAAAPAGPYHVSKQEMIVFNGFPAAGKSTFARTHLVPHGYVHVNQDTMKTKEKCLKASLAALQEKRSVVIDNTNPGADTRALYIAQAKKHGVPVRCFHFSTTLEMAQHLNVFRERLTDGAHKHVPRIGYAMYKKNFDTPTMSEGFTRCFHFSTTLEMAQHLNVFRERLTDGAHKHVPRIGYAMYKKNFDTPTMSEGFTEVKTIDFVPTFPSTPDGIKAKTLFYQLS